MSDKITANRFCLLKRHLIQPRLLNQIPFCRLSRNVIAHIYLDQFEDCNKLIRLKLTSTLIVVSEMTFTVSSGTLNSTIPSTLITCKKNMSISIKLQHSTAICSLISEQRIWTEDTFMTHPIIVLPFAYIPRPGLNFSTTPLSTVNVAVCLKASKTYTSER